MFGERTTSTLDDNALYQGSRLFPNRYRSVLWPSMALSFATLIVVLLLIGLFKDAVTIWLSFASAGGPGPMPSPNVPSPMAGLQFRASLGAAIIAAWVVFTVKLAERITARLGTTEIALFHVAAICRAMVATNIPHQFAGLLPDPKLGGFADQARDEDYLTFFDGSSVILAELDRLTIARITEFVVYLKLSRDATRSMARWSDTAVEEDFISEQARRRKDVIAILYILFLTFEAADACITRLATRSEKKFLQRLLAPSLIELYDTLILQPEITVNTELHALLSLPRRKKCLENLRLIKKTYNFM